jgi:hypothetical protein
MKILMKMASHNRQNGLLRCVSQWFYGLAYTTSGKLPVCFMSRAIKPKPVQIRVPGLCQYPVVVWRKAPELPITKIAKKKVKAKIATVVMLLARWV